MCSFGGVFKSSFSFSTSSSLDKGIEGGSSSGIESEEDVVFDITSEFN